MKEERLRTFIVALLADPRRNATAAARAAGVSAGSAKKQGSRWRQLPEVQAALDGISVSTKGEAKRAAKTSKVSTRMSTNSTEAPAQEGEQASPRPTPVQDAEPLTDRQQRFCLEYLVDGNAVRAYLRVYHNCSYESAKSSAHDLLTKPHISARVNELQAERNERLGITADRVLSVLARQAFYDPRELFDDDGRIKPIGEIPPDAAFAMVGMTTKSQVVGDEKDGICTTVNLRLADRTRAAELLGRNLKLFTDRVELVEDESFARKLAIMTEAAKSGKYDK